MIIHSVIGDLQSLFIYNNNIIIIINLPTYTPNISRINIRIWATAHLPFPNPTLTLTCYQLTVVQLGEGQVGSCPDTNIDPTSMYFIYTVLCTFCKVLTRRICLLKSLFQLVIIYFILVTITYEFGMILQGEIKCQSLLEVKVLSCHQNDKCYNVHLRP